MSRPKIIDLKSVGSDEGGYLSVLNIGSDLPFVPQRLYWVYGTPASRQRGSHAHINDRQVLVCVHGKVDLRLENLEGEIFEYTLSSPDSGLYVPGRHWREITYSDDTVLLVISSDSFSDSDYVRDYEQFLQLRNSRV